MSPLLVFGVIAGYFALLLLISYLTSLKSDSLTFYTGNRESPWFLVAFGMVGASLSGVTFISVPGEVGNTQWAYLQFVMGNMVGYAVIGLVLIPLFYKLNLISIYEYLKTRFGQKAYLSGATIFLISQTIGASFRLFLAATVLQLAFFDAFGIPFYASVLTTMVLIWLYTYKSGIKTIVWTDTLQTVFLLLAVVITIIVIGQHLGIDSGALLTIVKDSELSSIFVWEGNTSQNFFKMFAGGIFITIAMNGLDQNVMQKNLTCRNQREAQKNIFWFSITFFLSNLLFLGLGVLLYHYADANGIDLPKATDELFPFLALNHFGTLAGVVFLLGITAAAFSSADSALTALTTSFCIDIVDLPGRKNIDQDKTRRWIHIGFTFLVFLTIVAFNEVNDRSVVSAVFKAAGFTYGPLLGLFAFGLTNKMAVRDKLVPYICLLSPFLSFILDWNAATWFNGFQFGFEILLVNAAITYIGLLLSSKGATSA
ncbi:sodium:solute symporter [Cyclobacterium qasimii]|uniref:Sodium/iodide co-transporter n=2 Tax=Cyclobacterium qasimii TaxID=1350429 RepID=S7VMA6_9BACT|nr:sodium:solute symporter [Cyclobacterium qasimii]EPR70562.1 sodium/iodide co-transporter [Cyclobacterium qasimii M12-11B]GEO22261.1 sodium:solute symporter [Cyclobacterium qasimii]